MIIAAAKVGGINANKNFPYEFLIENLRIQSNIIDASKILELKDYFFLEVVVYILNFVANQLKRNFIKRLS